MKLTAIVAAIGLASSALAAPFNEARHGYQWCISQWESEKLVNEYIAILSHTNSDLGTPNVTAQAILDDNYTETSDSILSLEGFPLGTATFVGKTLYIANVLNAPAVTGIETVAIYPICPNKILWQWIITGIGSQQYEVKGFNLFSVTEAGQIGDAYLEFNSFAWALDTGYTITFPPPRPT